MTYNCYDLSVVQGNLTPQHFQQIKSSGITAIINRAGVGNSGIDSLFQYNIANARAQGLLCLAYNFVFPLPTTPEQPLRDPIKQAQYHYSNSSICNAAIDIEYPTQDLWQKFNCSANQINDWCLTYLDTYTKLQGKPPYIYTFPYYASTVNFRNDFAKYPLWIASYAPTPLIPQPWLATGQSPAIWQTTGGGGRLPNGAPVDTNIVYDFHLFT